MAEFVAYGADSVQFAGKGASAGNFIGTGILVYLLAVQRERLPGLGKLPLVGPDGAIS